MSGAAIIIFLSFFLYSDAGEEREKKKREKEEDALSLSGRGEML